jgi:plastocyanin
MATVAIGLVMLALTSFAKSPTATAPRAAAASVKISNFQFTPKVLTVAPGTTVEWVNEAGRHSVEADDGSFKSDVLKQGDKFQHKFDKAGTYAYHCEFHGDKGGKDMAGKIVVRGK